jgi:hypothetical protein
MSLHKVQAQDWKGNFAYAPPVVDALVNTDHVVRVVPTESRGPGPWVSVVLVDGATLICRGTPETFLGRPVVQGEVR